MIRTLAYASAGWEKRYDEDAGLWIINFRRWQRLDWMTNYFRIPLLAAYARWYRRKNNPWSQARLITETTTEHDNNRRQENSASLSLFLSFSLLSDWLFFPCFLVDSITRFFTNEKKWIEKFGFNFRTFAKRLFFERRFDFSWYKRSFNKACTIHWLIVILTGSFIQNSYQSSSSPMLKDSHFRKVENYIK